MAESNAVALRREYHARYYAENRDRFRELALKNKFSLSLEKYDALLEAQGGGCAICGKRPTSRTAWHVDHDHACCPGEKSCGSCIRGLLCPPCNVGIGRFDDDPERLRQAAEYLEKPYVR